MNNTMNINVLCLSVPLSAGCTVVLYQHGPDRPPRVLTTTRALCNGSMDRRINGQTDLDQWTDESIDRWISDRSDQWTKGSMDRLVSKLSTSDSNFTVCKLYS